MKSNLKCSSNEFDIFRTKPHWSLSLPWLFVEGNFKCWFKVISWTDKSVFGLFIIKIKDCERGHKELVKQHLCCCEYCIWCHNIHHNVEISGVASDEEFNCTYNTLIIFKTLTIFYFQFSFQETFPITVEGVNEVFCDIFFFEIEIISQYNRNQC